MINFRRNLNFLRRINLKSHYQPIAADFFRVLPHAVKIFYLPLEIVRPTALKIFLHFPGMLPINFPHRPENFYRAILLKYRRLYLPKFPAKKVLSIRRTSCALKFLILRAKSLQIVKFLSRNLPQHKLLFRLAQIHQAQEMPQNFFQIPPKILV